MKTDLSTDKADKCLTNGVALKFLKMLKARQFMLRRVSDF